MPDADDPAPRTALIAGSTGLVGRHLLASLLADDTFARVVTVGRRDVPVLGPKHTHHVVDFAQLEAHSKRLAATDVFCALGTTMKQAGSKEAFREVDFEYVRHLARQTRLAGAERFALVSAVGADPDSWFFYNRVKGDAERAVGVEPFRGVYLFRPSLLLGEREEKRSGEGVAERIMKPLAPLMIGPLANFRPMDAADVARAMVRVMQRGPRGIRLYEVREMRAVLRGGEAADLALEGAQR